MFQSVLFILLSRNERGVRARGHKTFCFGAVRQTNVYSEEKRIHRSEQNPTLEPISLRKADKAG